MNLVYGEIVKVFRDGDWPAGTVRVRGTLTGAALGLVPDAQPGDQVLLCDGVALSKVQAEKLTNPGESKYVSGHSR